MNSMTATKSPSVIDVTTSDATPARDGAQALQRRGKALVVVGWVVTVVSAVLYCVTCFAGGVDADVAEILSTNVVPFARVMLLATGLGTMLWLVGSFVYLKGAMDGGPGPSEGEGAQ